MFGFGISELLVILTIVLVIFGARKLPEFGAGMGKAIGSFKKAIRESNETDTPSERSEVEEKTEELKA